MDQHFSQGRARGFAKPTWRAESKSFRWASTEKGGDGNAPPQPGIPSAGRSPLQAGEAEAWRQHSRCQDGPRDRGGENSRSDPLLAAPSQRPLGPGPRPARDSGNHSHSLKQGGLCLWRRASSTDSWLLAASPLPQATASGQRGRRAADGRTEGGNRQADDTAGPRSACCCVTTSRWATRICTVRLLGLYSLLLISRPT